MEVVVVLLLGRAEEGSDREGCVLGFVEVVAAYS